MALAADGIEETADIARILTAITAACKDIEKRLAPRLAVEDVSAINQDALARRVGASSDPIMFALTETAEIVLGMAQLADEIAGMLRGVTLLNFVKI